MRVVALYRFPVKSLGGESPACLQPRQRGFEDDRRWMLVDKSGRFISQREHPRLARYSARTMGTEGLQIQDIATGQSVWESARARPAFTDPRPVTVWDDTFTAVEVPDSGDLGIRLGLPEGRLVYMPAGSVRPVDQRYARPDETVSFADGFPYLIANTASLNDLSQRLGKEVDMLRFRPNIVVEAAEPYAEDGWASIRIGTHQFTLPKACARCVMVTHEPDTGARDPAVLATLAAYRQRGRKVLFAENALWRGGEGIISVGDPVAVESYRPTDPS